MTDNNIIIIGGRNYGRSLLHEAIKSGLINELPKAHITYADLKDVKEKFNELKIPIEENLKRLLELYEGTRFELMPYHIEFTPYHINEMDIESRIIRESFGFKKSRKCNNAKRPKPRKKKRK